MEKFISCMKEVLDTSKEINMDSVLAEIEEWDSLAMVSFAAMANVEFGITLQASQIKEAKTIKDLFSLI